MGRVCKCTVRFIDRGAVERSTQVQAASTYEAVCPWTIFKLPLETEEESYLDADIWGPAS
jgi:hypothetical protein